MVIEKGAPNTNNAPQVREEGDDVSEEEYNAINQQLDQLNGWLDHLEQKNADIQAQLLDLLQKSKNTREEFQQMVTTDETTPESK